MGAVNPMVASGLVLAGANRPGTPGRGVLTGEALLDRDLSGLELADCARRCQPSIEVLFLASNGGYDEIVSEEQLDRFEWLPRTASPEAIVARVAQRLALAHEFGWRAIERARELHSRVPVTA